MWPILPDFRWEPGRSHVASARVEVWSAGARVEADAPILDGSVTERWVTGVRASLSLSLPPTAEWFEWLALPTVDLRPFAGISWGGSSVEAPLGVFPVEPPQRSLPATALTVSAEDRWQKVTQNDFLTTRQGPPGTNTGLAASLMWEAGLGDVQIAVARPVWSNPLMWDKTRQQMIEDYLEPTGSEAFVDRTGAAIIRDRTTSPGMPLTDGVDGTVVSITSTVDWSKVANWVAATSSRNDVVIDPQIVSITDWSHPAHESRIGKRTFRYSSALIASVEDAQAAAAAQLAKLSAPALSWSVKCVPDPTRMPGDSLTVTTGLGVVQAVVQEVTHPLGKGEQSVKLGAAL